MSYASNADVELRLGTLLYVQLTNDLGVGSADEDRVTEARLAAEGEVNSYLGRRFLVPVDTSLHAELADVLRSVTLDLTEYRLHSRKPPVLDDIRRKRDQAVQWLQRVAGGEAVLPAGAELENNPATGIVGQAIGHPRVLSSREMRNL